MARNKDYWKKRMAALEDNQHRHGMDYYKDVQEQFRRATNSIQMDMERWYQRLADNNDISYAAAKRLLKKNELDEFHWSVEQYIKAGEENAMDQRWMKELENASARHHISYLEAMKIQAQQHAELLSAEFEGGMTDFLHKSYADSYYHTAFEISKGTGVGANIARLDDKRIDTMIKKPWARDGANFSDRIWTNKEKLVNNLHTELTQSIIRGDPPQKAIEGLAKTMNVSRAQAGRLIMTESAAVSSAAAQDSYKELGVEQYEILATLDSLTSEICRDLDGKVFDMKDYAVGDTAPPFHPHCRTTTVPFFDDEFSAVEKRAARDEETGDTVYVDGQMNYREWEKKYDPKTEETKTSGIKRNSEQMKKRCTSLRTEAETYSPRKSRWSGNINVDNKRCEQEDCSGIKAWNCDIIVRDDVPDGVILHELLHSCSASYHSPADYIEHQSIEEASVELLTQEIAGKTGIVHIPSYTDLVGILRNLNYGLGLYESDMEFAEELFKQSMTERFNWLQDKVNGSIIHNEKISIDEAGAIMDYVGKLGGGLGG